MSRMAYREDPDVEGADDEEYGGGSINDPNPSGNPDEDNN